MLAAACSVELEAEVQPGLQVISGSFKTNPAIPLIDPLAALPAPANDRELLTTFPAKAERGSVVWTETESGLQFTTALPRRFGDIGWLEKRGLRANGGWYPQAVVGERLAWCQWKLSVRIPAGSVGILNGVLGEAVLSWQGEADRVGLAVVPKAQITELKTDLGTLVFVEQSSEKPLHRWMEQLLASGWGGEPDFRLVLVESLDLQQLAVPAPGMVFLSDRAARIFPLLTVAHAVAVRKALHEAALPLPWWWAAFVAEAQTITLPQPTFETLMGFFSWNPLVDALLNDGTLPFYNDIFDHKDQKPPGIAILEEPRLSPGAALAQARLLGLDLHSITQGILSGDFSKLPEELLESWDTRYDRQQNYRVEYTPEGTRLSREASPEAPSEVVELLIDKQSVLWEVGPGPAEWLLPGKSPIRLDPDQLTVQTQTVDDHQPMRFRPVLTGGIYNVAPTQHSFDLFGEIYGRREGDTRRLYYLALLHDQQDLAALIPGVVFYFGPLMDLRRRAHRLALTASASLLDPEFRPPEGNFALGTGVRYAYDTRLETQALHGARYSLGVGGGWIPGTTEVWGSVFAGAVQYVPLHPMHVLAFRLSGGMVSGDVEHRLITLGGSDMVRSLPENSVTANLGAVGNIEYRLALFRHASVPLLAGWLSELRLVPGLEAGWSIRSGLSSKATGITLGIFSVVDILGVRPALSGVTFAWPVWTENVPVDPPSFRNMQIYIDVEHAF